MTSKIKVDNIENQCGGAVVTKCGGTTTIAGTNVNATTVTATNVVGSTAVKSNAIQASDGGNLVSQSGTTITLGASGDTINLASGASQSGFGREGSVDWDTTPKTSTFTAANGIGYFVNTSGGAVTVNLPAGVAGNIIAVNDYGNNSSSNNITINPNGSEKIQGDTTDRIINTNGVTVTLVYVDGTQGWKVVDSGEVSNLPQVALFTTATGGNSCGTNGNFKFHIFTGPGTFCVSQVGNSPVNPAGGPAVVDYLVLAGGAGGGSYQGGGGGAGGFRESHSVPVSGCYTASPLATATGITLPAAGPFAVAVGAGGAPGQGNGSVSTFSTITSTGGGGGQNGVVAPGGPGGNPGGSGGGGNNGSGSGGVFPGGSGNTPPVSPPQGQPGGNGTASAAPSVRGNAGGGGGAISAGGNGSPAPGGGGNGMPGGNGVATDISDGLITRAGGGGGGAFGCGPTGGSGGSGGGGAGGNSSPFGSGPFAGVAGTVNTGSGGGGAGRDGAGGSTTGAAGGSGIVVIRYRFQ